MKKNQMSVLQSSYYAIYSVLIISLFLFTGCKQKVEKEIISRQEEQLNEKLDNWHRAAAEADYENYFGFIASEGIYIGTDVTEHWTKKEFSAFSKPYFDKGKAWSFQAKERNIFLSADAQVAWFDEVLDTWMGDCRASGVLTVIEGEWKLQHYQLSVTVPNEKIKEFLELTAKQ
ncbi:nuclear transport factor 2 family protein [Algivirga pacifica]|uniref:Nuclear transport factor 2 family protein n=1 Tax=Algivirga pacifica TaxID=1162670 RepID=A0ABP9CZV4_9BACT